MRRLLLLFFPFLIFAQQPAADLDLYFDSGSAALGADDKKQLQDYFGGGHQQIIVQSIQGYCDDIGTVSSNMSLSLQRAKTVAAYLSSEFGLHSAVIMGNGEIPLDVGPGENIQRAANRKVSIFVDAAEVVPAATDRFATEVPDKQYKTIKDSLITGDKIIIPNLLFEGSMTVFADAEEAEKSLFDIIQFLNQNLNIEFEVQGHVCCISAAFRDARDIHTGKNNLSVARAKRVYDYLIEKGISPDRMTFGGYGRRFPLKGMPENLNKRVEIVITRM